MTKRKLLPALLFALAAPAWATCSYPLDGTQADLDATPVTQGWTLAPVYNGQSMQVNVTPTDGQTLLYAAFSHQGLLAMQQAATSNTPRGDLVLPATGTAHVRMHIDNFPWGSFSGTAPLTDLILSVLTGNEGAANPLPKDALELNVALVNASGIYAGRRLGINGQSIRGSQVSSISRLESLGLPFPADIVGFWINVDTREIGLSVRISVSDPSLPPPGDYDLPALTDNQGAPFLLPDSVKSVAVGLGAIVSQIPGTDPLQGAPIGATLESDHCGSGPTPLPLPNGKLFPGKGKALGLQMQAGWITLGHGAD